MKEELRIGKTKQIEVSQDEMQRMKTVIRQRTNGIRAADRSDVFRIAEN